jgi:hypothetical protein
MHSNPIDDGAVPKACRVLGKNSNERATGAQTTMRLLRDCGLRRRIFLDVSGAQIG